MSTLRAYIAPFKDDGTLDDFTEVTEDLVSNSLGVIRQQLDNDEYNVGQFKFSKFAFKLRNDHGHYSDAGVFPSIFKVRVGGSKFRLTWQINDGPTQCGLVACGTSEATINPDLTLYEGIINEDSGRSDITNQTVSFNVLSYDSVFSAVETPFSLLSVGDLYSEILLTLLNQSDITQYLTIDAANINVGLDLTVDVVTGFENTSVKEALDKVLFQSNSVLFINSDTSTLFIRSRDADAASVHTFIGQASNDGIEDIADIKEVGSGLNKTFNFWTWEETTLVASDSTSIDTNGLRKKEISFDEITDTGKRQSVLDAQRDEFSTKKRAFNVKTFLNYDTLALSFLNRVFVDYPTINFPAEFGDDLPVYGLAVYGEATYPFSQFAITVDKSIPFKIMGIDIDTKKQNMIFKLKEI